MTQEIIVIIFIIAVIGFVVYSRIKKFHSKPTGSCNGCSGCPTPCELNDLVTASKKNREP